MRSLLALGFAAEWHSPPTTPPQPPQPPLHSASVPAASICSWITILKAGPTWAGLVTLEKKAGLVDKISSRERCYQGDICHVWAFLSCESLKNKRKTILCACVTGVKYWSCVCVFGLLCVCVTDWLRVWVGEEGGCRWKLAARGWGGGDEDWMQGSGDTRRGEDRLRRRRRRRMGPAEPVSMATC